MAENQPKRILLVEDEAITAMAEKKDLQKYGYNVHHVLNGEDAVQKATKSVQSIDLILMDIDLGSGMDGTQAAEEILKQKDIPIVFLSSHIEPEIVDKTEKITSYGYVVKNSGITVLDASIKMAFRLFDEKQKVNHKQMELETTNEQLENANEELVKSQQEILQSEVALRVSETKFRAIFENSVDAIGVSKAGTHVFVNPAYLKLFGYTSEKELIGKSIIDVIAPGEHEKIISNVHRRASGETVPSFYETRGHRKDKSEFEMDVHVSTYTMHDELFTVVIVRDITARKGAEEILRKAEKLKEKMMANIGDVIVIIDKDGVNRYKSPNVEKLFGWKPKELVGNSTWDNIHPEDIKSGKKFMLKVAKETNAVGNLEVRYRHKDGSYRWIHFTAANLLCDPDIQGILGNYHDITEEKQAEQQLKESEIRFRALHNASFGGIAIHDKGVILDSNQGLSEMTGYPLTELIGMDGLLLISEGTRDLVMNNILSGYENPYEAIGRKKNGDEYPIRLEARNIPYMGKSIRVVEFRDLTEQKKAEKALLQSDIDLKEAQRLAHVGSWRLNLATNEVVMSEELYKMYNLDPALPPPSFPEHMKFFTPDSWERLSNSITKTVETGTPYELELETVKGDGTNGWIWIHGERIKDSDGKTITLRGATQDITEKKEAERIIKQQLREKEVLLREVHHRIKNNINSIRSLLSLQADSITNEESKHIIADAIGRVDSMRQIYDKLLLADEYEKLSVKEYIEDLVTSIIDIFPEKEKISVNKDCDDFIMEVKRLSPLGTITNELVTNSMKYAFAGMDSGNIFISLKRNGDKAVLTLRDDGVGLPEGFDTNKTTGFGIILVKMLAEQLKGNFSIKSDGGTKNILQFTI